MADENLIRQIAQQIVEKEILTNWKFYGLLVIIQILLTWASAYLTKYAEKRGEALATKADFDQILLQLKKSTAASEEIKTTLAHKDWTIKEFKLLRRTKLEDLLTEVHVLHRWNVQYIQRAFLAPSLDVDVESNLSRLQVLSELYFPEFDDEVTEFCSKCAEMWVWVAQLQLTLRELGEGTVEYETHKNLSRTEIPTYALELGALKRKLSAKAGRTMADLIDYR